MMLTIDTGHYHPTEVPGDKVSAVLQLIEEYEKTVLANR